MKLAIAQIQADLDTASRNAPIHLAEGRPRESKHSLEVAKSLRKALALLRKAEKASK